MNHDVYLLLAFLTHGVIGYALVRGLTDFPPLPGALGGVVPDVDLYLGPVLGLPVVHRGAVHTPAALAVLVGVALLLGAPRRVPAAFGVGFLSHLVVDTFTSAGIMWLYPASHARASLDVAVHGATGTVVLWLASLALVRFGPRIKRAGRSDE